MFCSNCGIHNDDRAFKCHQCGQVIARLSQPGAAAEEINTYLVPAIISVLCCCVLFGMISVIFAAQAKGRLEAGDMAGALEKARLAKIWFWVAFAGGMLFWLGMFLFYFFVFAAAFAEAMSQAGY